MGDFLLASLVCDLTWYGTPQKKTRTRLPSDQNWPLDTLQPPGPSRLDFAASAHALSRSSSCATALEFEFAIRKTRSMLVNSGHTGIHARCYQPLLQAVLLYSGIATCKATFRHVSQQAQFAASHNPQNTQGANGRLLPSLVGNRVCCHTHSIQIAWMLQELAENHPKHNLLWYKV